MNDFPMEKAELITHALIPVEGDDWKYSNSEELMRKATWQNRVRRTRGKITDLLWESRERSVSDDDKVMGIPIIETLMYLQSKIHPTNLLVFPQHTQVVMLSDAGVHWCNLVRGVVTGKFDDYLFREVKK